MELRIPPSVSKIRGGGFPAIGFNEIPFGMIAPRRLRSKKSLNSGPNPKVPEETTTGFLSVILPILTVRSQSPISSFIPDDVFYAENGAFLADPLIGHLKISCSDDTTPT